MTRDEFEKMEIGDSFMFQGKRYVVKIREAYSAIENGVVVRRNHSVTCFDGGRVKVIDSIVEEMELIKPIPEEGS